MNDLVKIMRNDAVVSSLQIAEHFGKRHDRVLRAIENALTTDPKNGVSDSPFRKSYYKDESGKKNLMYYLTRDGFSFVVMGFTGKKAAEWKWKYIAAFNEMERILIQQRTMEWKDARLLGKQARREETDEIKELIAYAEGQGSTHASMMYVTYSKLVKKMLGFDKRENADALTLSRAAEMERIIRRVIVDGIAAGDNYKKIYQAAKARLAAYSEIAYLTT